MQFEANIIADSIASYGGHRIGARITTFQLCYPRFIHAELMTHRVFSRNAMSSRAIPIEKMIAQVEENPAMPCHWGTNKPGMQAGVELHPMLKQNAIEVWREAAFLAAMQAEKMRGLGVHKQIANRLLEPFQWMRTIVTATEWDNFWSLRCHEAAEPNFEKLARMMQAAYNASTPVPRLVDRNSAFSWHLPYVTSGERAAYGDQPMLLAKLSTARCARVSYLNHDGTSADHAKDLDLFHKLVGSHPMHASPAEHQAYPSVASDVSSGNFRGWRQWRKWLEKEQVGKSLTAAA
jgi:hypothetical protein